MPTNGSGQSTLAEWGGDDPDAGEGADMADRVDALRADLDRLTALVDTLAESQKDLAGAVEDTLPDDHGEENADSDTGEGLTTAGRGFQ